MVSGLARHRWHQVSVRSVKHWPARATRVNGHLAISVPGSGTAGRGCHVVTLDSLWSDWILFLRYHRVLELFMTEAEKLSFVLTTMRCVEVESILAAWPLPRHSIKPSHLPALELLRTQTRMEEERRKGTGSWVTGYCPQDCVRSWAHLMELFPDIPGPSPPKSRPNSKWGESSWDNALSAISLVKTPHCIFVFYENSICLNKYTHFSLAHSSPTTPTQR